MFLNLIESLRVMRRYSETGTRSMQSNYVLVVVFQDGRTNSTKRSSI